MRKLLLIGLWQGLALLTVAQVPFIQKVERLATFPRDRVIISGSGFSNTPAQLQVWFDQTQGSIVSSTEFAIEAEVPAQARLSNVTVVNLASRFSAQSPIKFMPVFSGAGFSASNLTSALALTSAARVFEITTADVDGDGRPDLVGTRNENTATNLFISLNTSTVGNLSFAAPGTIGLAFPTEHLAMGDLNGDGRPDLVASRAGTTANVVFVMANTSSVGSPSFAAPIQLTLDANHIARQICLQDFDGDGRADIAVANSFSNELYLYRNESSAGTLTINPTPTKITVTNASNTLAIEADDLDGDGKADLVATQNLTNDIFILRNTTAGSFSFATTRLTVPGTFNDVATVDLNRDGKLDLVAASVFTAQLSVLVNQSSSGTISFQAPSSVSTDTQPFGLDVSDVNGDGFADVVAACRGASAGTGLVNVFLHNGGASPTFTKVNIATAKSNFFCRVGDLDGDAKPDFAFSSFNPGFTVDVIRNQNCHQPRILNQAPIFICPGQTIRLQAIPLPGVTFEWRKDAGPVSGTNSFLDITAAGSYTVTAIGESGACTIMSTPLVVQSGAGTLPADPVITSNAPVCEGATINLGTAPVAGATYQWTGPNNFTSTSQNVSIPAATLAQAGIYSLVVKVGDCSSNTATTRVDVATFGSFSISSNSASNVICNGQTVILSINAQAGYGYQWIKDGTDIGGQTGTTLNVTQEGAYRVRVTNLALSCSQLTNPVTVTVLTAPVATFTVPATGCRGTPVAFTNNSTFDSRASVIWAWVFGDGNTSAVQNPSHTYTTAQAFTPQLTVSYSGVSGCTNNTSRNITINAPVVPVVSATATTICPGAETTTLSVTGTFAAFNWSTGATTPTVDVSTVGNFSVTTTDANGCQATGNIDIVTKSDCASPSGPLTFPPAFTPNGDGQNDRWVITGVENYQSCTMNIYDGRGRKVFDVLGYPTNGWDGTFEGREVPAGTYYFVFACTSESPRTGTVLVIR